MSDVIMMHVYLRPIRWRATMDFAGMMAAYTKFFGTPEQPNKPARIRSGGGACRGGCACRN